MLARWLEHVRHNAVAYLALFVSLGGTGAYAANTIGSSDVVDDSLTSADIMNYRPATGQTAGSGGLAAEDLATGSVNTLKIADSGITQIDLSPNSVGSTRIRDDAVGTTEIADQAVKAGHLSYSLLRRSVPTYKAHTHPVQVECPSGLAVGGGARLFRPSGPLPDEDMALQRTEPYLRYVDGRWVAVGWQAMTTENDDTTRLEVSAICILG